MLHKIILTALFMVFSYQLQANAPAMSVNSAITDIVSGDAARADRAIEMLAVDRRDSTFAFVAALMAGEYTDVKLSRKQRRTLNRLMPFINMSDQSPLTRAEAYREIALLRITEDMTTLQSCMAKESDEGAKAALEEALIELTLFAGSNEEQSDAVDYIVSKRDMRFAGTIRAYVAQESVSNTNKSKAASAIKYYDMVERNSKIYQNIFSGLSLGSILILVSLGLSIVYGLAGIINMSHGEFLMIGAYTTYCVQRLFEMFLPESWLDLSFFVSLPISFIVAALFGLLIERTVLRHLYSRPLESMLATLGISLILIQLARSIFGDLTTVKSPAILSGGWVLDSGLILPYNRLFIIGLTIIIFIGVYQLFQRSRLGVKIRAVTQNRNMSACVGISTKRIDMITFMLGSGLAGVAGCAITLIGNVVPNMGQTYIVDSFLVVVTGGVGKLAGCAISGMGIGMLSKLFEVGFEAVYGKVLMLILIIVFLQYRPKGLFADKGRIGDD